MSVETEVASLTTATTNLTAAVALQQTGLNTSVASFDAAVINFNTVSTALSNVDNISDADKPLSDLAISGLAGKQETLVSGSNISTINGVSILGGDALVIARGRVEIPVLPYADIGTLRTPVTPVPTDGDVVNIPHLGLFQFTSIVQYQDDEETALDVFDPSDGVTRIGQWYLANPSYEWLEAQKLFEYAVMYEWMEDETVRHNS